MAKIEKTDKVNNYISEKEMEQAAISTRQKLDKQRKVRVIVPKDNKNPNITIKINGAYTLIPKGEEVEIPEDVYAVLKEYYDVMTAMSKRTEKATEIDMGKL